MKQRRSRRVFWDRATHRVSKSREEKGGGGDASIKLNLTDPCCKVPCQYHCLGMLDRQAGSTVSVYARVQCRVPKTGQQKVPQGRGNTFPIWRYNLSLEPPQEGTGCATNWSRAKVHRLCCPQH